MSGKDPRAYELLDVISKLLHESPIDPYLKGCVLIGQLIANTTPDEAHRIRATFDRLWNEKFPLS